MRVKLKPLRQKHKHKPRPKLKPLQQPEVKKHQSVLQLMSIKLPLSQPPPLN